MQDLTPSICRSITDTNTTGQLIDNRDDKIYWIAKLKDGNCWMVQNLDYDDPGGIRVTDTSGTNGGPSSSAWSNDNKIRQYWDPGEKVVSGSTLTSATSATDRHLLVGNYYSWQSAVANTGTTSSTSGDYPADAGGSICPNGWVLPTSNNTRSGSFGGLTSGISAGSTLIANPYYFQYGGNVIGGSLQVAGSQGYYWSSTASSGTNAYYLYFDSSGVRPSYTSTRYSGQSVRCLVQGS